jgi:hypothetical protein
LLLYAVELWSTSTSPPKERQTAIAEDEKYLDAKFLGEVRIKDKHGAIIEKRWLFFAGAYWGSLWNNFHNAACPKMSR